jgi:uncharacterized protein (TIGR02466 family)
VETPLMTEAETLRRAEALVAQGRRDEALALTEALVAAPAPSHMALACRAGVLKLNGRHQEALRLDEQAISRFASSPVAWHNYAATLDDMGRAEEAAAACEAAFRLGLDAPQTFAIYGRALRTIGDLERADYAYRQSLARAPAVTEVAIEFSNFLWMRTGDLQAADFALDSAFHAGAPPTPLLLAKATLYEAAGDLARCAALLDAASRKMPGDTAILMGCVEFALHSHRLDDAERYLRLVEAADPESRAVAQFSAIADLARGRAPEAFAKLRGILDHHPNDQSVWGWMVTAARAVGDPLYGELIDYDAMVGVYDLETPPGWTDMPTYLADLAEALKAIHVYRQHPMNQSLRHGSQSMNLLNGSSAPSIKAFFEAIGAPLRAHMARLGTGEDPLRRRNTFDYEIQGAWSVRLRPSGYHRDHFHPDGWLSSAFYVETPDAALETHDKQGWIRFGQPPFVTDPKLPPDHFVKPKPGRLVLFPSYLWHGTVPFTTDEARMTIAFDAVPK